MIDEPSKRGRLELYYNGHYITSRNYDSKAVKNNTLELWKKLYAKNFEHAIIKDKPAKLKRSNEQEPAAQHDKA